MTTEDNTTIAGDNNGAPVNVDVDVDINGPGPIKRRRYGQGNKKSKRKPRRRKTGKRRVPVAMRQCALPGCETAFYPQRPWQKFHDDNCAAKDRMRRWRERYRKLATAATSKGHMVDGMGGRKIVRRGSREITAAESRILEQIRRIGQPALDAVAGMLNGDLPRNRSPEPVGAGSGSLPPTKRIRNIRRVHPRSLEKQ